MSRDRETVVDLGPNSIGEKILTKNLSKNYNKNIKESVVYTCLLFKMDFREVFFSSELDL